MKLQGNTLNYKNIILMIKNKHMPKNTETIFTSPSRFAVEKKNK